MAVRQPKEDDEQVEQPKGKRGDNVVDLKTEKPDAPQFGEPAPETSYRKAKDVATVAEELIASELEHMTVLRHARILYVFTTADHISACDEMVGVTRFPKKMTALGKFDFYVLVAEPRWERSEPERRKAALYHALCHIGSDENGRWHIEEHDFVGFNSEVLAFGAWTERLAKTKQLGIFKVAHSATREEGGHMDEQERTGDEQAAETPAVDAGDKAAEETAEKTEN